MKIKWKKRWTRDAVFFAAGVATALVVGGILASVERKELPVAFQKEGVTISWLPNTVRHFKPAIELQAKRYDIDANFVAIIMTLESGGYTKANSGVAHGLMQVTPPTAGDIAKMYLRKPVSTYDLFDPLTSIEFGVAYLAHLRATLCDQKSASDWNECVEVVAAGYNGGPGAAIELKKGNGLKANETLYYSRNALSMWREKNAQNSPTFERWKKAGGQSLLDKAAQSKYDQ